MCDRKAERVSKPDTSIFSAKAGEQHKSRKERSEADLSAEVEKLRAENKRLRSSTADPMASLASAQRRGAHDQGKSEVGDQSMA